MTDPQVNTKTSSSSAGGSGRTPREKKEPSGEELFHALMARLDLQTPSRSQWRRVCTRTERAKVQGFLLEVTEGARAGSRADRLALYKAAHAVLPLHGAALLELVLLLVEMRPVPLPWCDALVEFLSETPPGRSPYTARVLETLRDTCDQAEHDAQSTRRVDWIRRHARAARYPLD